MKKWLIYKEDITTLNLYAPNNIDEPNKKRTQNSLSGYETFTHTLNNDRTTKCIIPKIHTVEGTVFSHSTYCKLMWSN